VRLHEDPVLYRKLSEKLEALIQKYRDNWELLYQELCKLRTEAEQGRKDEIEGVSKKAAPFYDLIGLHAFDTAGVPEQHAETLKGVVGEILEKLKGRISIINFWSNLPEVARLRGELSDLLLFSNIDEIVSKRESLVTEITALARSREKDILT